MTKFGYVSVEDYVPLVGEFAESLVKGKIFATKCKACGKEYFPPREECICLNDEMEKIDLDTSAKLVSYTIIHVPPESHSTMAPYIIAIGEFPNGLKTMAHLVGVTSMDDLKIGRPMKLVPQTLENERIVYKFVPA